MKHIFEKSVYVSLFLLPWQTRYVFGQILINGQPFEYGVLSLYFVELLVIMAFFIGQPLQVLKDHQKITRMLGVVLITALLSVPFAANPQLSFYAWIHFVIAGLLFFVLLDRRIVWHKALSVFVLGLIIPALLGLMQTMTGFSPAGSVLGLAEHGAGELGVSVVETDTYRFMRAYGTFPHPNMFGGYLAVGLLGIITLLSSKRNTIFSKGRLKHVLRTLLLISIPISSFGFVVTFSRSAWLGLFTAIVLGSALLFGKSKSEIKRILPIMALTFLALATAFAVFREPIISRFHSTSEFERRSIIERQAQYDLFSETLNQSIITGVGIGSYTVALSAVESDLPSWAYQPVHNSYFLAFAELGIIGTVALLVFIYLEAKIGNRAIKKHSIHAIAAISFATILFVIAFFDHYLWSMWGGLALCAFVLALTLRLFEKRSK